MLSAEEKLSQFSMKVLDNANQKRNVMLEDFKKEQEELLEAKELEFLEEAYQKIQESIGLIRKEGNEKEAGIENEYRIKLLTTRKQIFEEVFDKVLNKLNAFMKTDDYYSWLKSHIKSGIDEVGEGEIVIYLNKSDKGYADAVKEAFASCSVEIADEDIIGGCKVYNSTRGLISDYSMALEIEQEK